MNNAPYVCDICGKPMFASNSIFFKDDNDKWVHIHYVCYDQYIGKCITCSTCVCNLDKDTTMPRIVMKTVQHGNMVMQTQVINPDLVNKYCKSGCVCWNGTNCLRQTVQSCDKYTLIIKGE